MLTRPPKMISAGRRIRVLAVDDSVVVRKLLTLALKEDPLIEVVGTAGNGAIGLAKIPQVNPDVITLDIEMPEMNGLETLRKLRELYPDLVVIVVSTLTSPGATSTLDALMLGANDYITKPSNAGSMDACIATLRTDLLPKIRQFFCTMQAPATVPITARWEPGKSPNAEPCPPEVLAIGVSTGGPNALSEIIPMFPDDFDYPVLIVQHMPPVFTRLLAERLQVLTKLRVEEATQRCSIQPGKILIAPGDFHMTARKSGPERWIALEQSTRRNSCRPSVDVLFESVAETYGGAAVGAVLTGMGQDGLCGAQAMKANGAYIIAQDKESSVVWSMPGSLVGAGIPDAVLPLHSIVPNVLKQFGYKGVAVRAAGSQ